ncbi:F-box family protein [Rhynchospora pubera]|uniref:F-box family protein n=1 Tax=Rhynchospora pubera TaxID=906938 RepID=A0AAV8GPA5_9POAL|nr:F-box family protein [Rhynchospora pubera]
MNRRIDRISTLSDDVLMHILSFLRTRDAVRTCILSKRWRNIWASVSVLNFDFHYFNTDDVQKFDQFVIGALKNRGSSDLNTLIYRGTFSKPSMRWIPSAARLMPLAIIIDITVLDKYRFPDSVFSCASLENLELCYFTYGRSVIRPKSIDLPSLKTLKLGYIKLEENLVQKIFLGCPALENLKLYECELYITEISSNVLKDLALDDCWLCRLRVQISCRGLVSLFIRTSIETIRTIVLENTDSLENACISLYGCDQKVNVDNVLNSNFLSGLSNTKNLELYFCHLPECKEQWVKDISNCGIFNNLRILKIGAWNMVNDFSLVACFLEHSPLLEQLTLRIDRWRDIIQEMLGQDASLEFEQLLRVKEVCDKKNRLKRDVIQEMPRQDVSFQIDYLDTVNISCRKKDRLGSKMVSVLGQHVKTIRNINIREY